MGSLKLEDKLTILLIFTQLLLAVLVALCMFGKGSQEFLIHYKELAIAITSGSFALLKAISD